MRFFLVGLGFIGAFMNETSARAHSGDYRCFIRDIEADLSIEDTRTSTHLFLIDQSTNQTLTQAFVGSLENNGEETTLHFYSASGETKVTFLTSELASLPQTMNVYLESNSAGVYIWDTAACSR